MNIDVLISFFLSSQLQKYPIATTSVLKSAFMHGKLIFWIVSANLDMLSISENPIRPVSTVKFDNVSKYLHAFLVDLQTETKAIRH